MFASHADLLACPICQTSLQVEPDGGRLAAGIVRCRDRHRFVFNNVARFVSADELSPRRRLLLSQELDSVRETRYWEETFVRLTGAPPAALAGKRVLEIGCANGRFTEWLSKYAATLVGVEPTMAVGVCRDALGELPHVLLLQADPQKLPLKLRQFDTVLLWAHGALGREEFDAAVRMVAAGGQLWIADTAFESNRFMQRAWRSVFRSLPGWLAEPVVETYVAASQKAQSRLLAYLLPQADESGVPDMAWQKGRWLELPEGTRFSVESIVAWCRRAGLSVSIAGDMPHVLRAKKPALARATEEQRAPDAVASAPAMHGAGR